MPPAPERCRWRSDKFKVRVVCSVDEHCRTARRERIILGLVRASSGSVHLFGHAPADPASRLDIGFIPGDLRLYGDMTALATLDFFARFRRKPPMLRQRLLDAFALDEATLKRRVKFLSHGTRQKVGLIAAMQHDPALLLLDEPSNGLDPLVQQAFRETLRDFAARGGSVALSSHILSEAESVCQRVTIGRLTANLVLLQGSIYAMTLLLSAFGRRMDKSRSAECCSRWCRI